MADAGKDAARENERRRAWRLYNDATTGDPYLVNEATGEVRRTCETWPRPPRDADAPAASLASLRLSTLPDDTFSIILGFLEAEPGAAWRLLLEDFTKLECQERSYGGPQSGSMHSFVMYSM